MRLLYLFLIVMLTTGAVITERASAQDGRYEAGQVWTYRSGQTNNPSRIVVGKTETLLDLGPAVHVSIIGIPMTDPQTGRRFFTDVYHVAFAVSAMDLSVIEVESIVEVHPGFAESYENWRRTYDNGEVGIFTEPVASILQAMRGVIPESPQEAIRQKREQEQNANPPAPNGSSTPSDP
ncbi:MAG: hypothetical protein E2O89_02025 [Alphaproteobacteria bacterium]|nr:MAG: hypothetical protein E2O89_02025 [Alphaproteobacteria bacterium]